LEYRVETASENLEEMGGRAMSGGQGDAAGMPPESSEGSESMCGDLTKWRTSFTRGSILFVDAVFVKGGRQHFLPTVRESKGRLLKDEAIRPYSGGDLGLPIRILEHHCEIGRFQEGASSTP